MTRPLRVAILGAGIGRQHLAGYQELPGQFRVKTICDVELERAKQLARSGNTIGSTDDADDVFSDPEIDVVDICLPPGLHLAYSIKAIDAGKHVICEKPLVTSLADADVLLDRLKRSSVVFAPVFQYRFGVALQQVRALAGAKVLGSPIAASLETHWRRGGEYYSVPWRGTWDGEHGGAVLSHAVHIHDLLCEVFGRVKEVAAFVATRVNRIEVEDCASIAFHMESGALATSSVTLGAASNTSRLRFIFTNVTIESTSIPYAPCSVPWTFEARDSNVQCELDRILESVEPTKTGYAGFFEEVASRISGSTSKGVTVDEAYRSLEIVSAVYQSARRKEVVSLPVARESSVYQGWKPNSLREAR